MDKKELINRTQKFAIRVFKLVDKLPKSEASRVITYQLPKASSLVAANYRAVNRAKSKNDFSNKVKIVLEEADESNFWLTFISDLELLKEESNELNSLILESDEFIAIFTASLKTLNSQANLNSKILNPK